MEWSVWWRDYQGTALFIYEYETIEAAEEAVDRLSTRDPDLDDVYEIRQLVDGEWVTQFVAKWTFLMMVPSEEYDYE